MKNKEYIKFLKNCEKGDLVNVILYVKLGNNFKQENYLALTIVAKAGHTEIVKYLVNKGGYPKDNISIVAASEKGFLDIVELLNKNLPLLYQYNSLEAALKNGHEKIVKYWYKKIDSLQNENFNALFSPCAYGHLEFVKHLVEEKKLDATFNNNECINAAIKNAKQHVLEYFQENNINVLKDNLIIEEKVEKSMKPLKM